MAPCYFCNGKLTLKEGLTDIDIPIDQGIAIKINNPYSCSNCGKHYLTGEQLVEGFIQIKESIFHENKEANLKV